MGKEDMEKVKFTFEDLEKDNGSGDLFYKATGIILEVCNKEDFNRAFVVMFLNPFTGEVREEWRGVGDVYLTPIDEAEWSDIRDCYKNKYQKRKTPPSRTGCYQPTVDNSGTPPCPPPPPPRPKE